MQVDTFMGETHARPIRCNLL